MENDWSLEGLTTADAIIALLAKANREGHVFTDAELRSIVDSAATNCPEGASTLFFSGKVEIGGVEFTE